MREAVNAILSVVHGGISWRAMPHDLLPWSTAYHYFRLWRDDGTWQAIHDALDAQVRGAAGREPSPSAAILASQRVQTTDQGGRAGTTRGSRRPAANATTWLSPTDD